MPTLKRGVVQESTLGKRRKTHDGDESDHWQAGAILRISVENFVTYDRATCFPGPHLNLVIGPNGSGKSTLVCAIALGLGGGPNLLGRQSEINEFVKCGKEQAFIEIELKAAREGSLVIKRVILAADNKSFWYVNGKASTRRAVLDSVSSLNIQVDNLCQFLPQDKISLFAEMTPEQLLDATQRAAGRSGMAESHKMLVDLKQDERTRNAAFQANKDELHREISKNTRLEADMARFKEHERLLEQMKVLEALLLWLKYKDDMNRVSALKEQRAQTLKKTKSIETEVSKLLKQQSDLQGKESASRSAIRDADRESGRLERSAAQLKSSIQSLDAEVESLHQQLEGFNAKVVQDDLKLRELEQQVAEGEKTAEQRRLELVQLGFIKDSLVTPYSKTDMYQIEEQSNALMTKIAAKEELVAEGEVKQRRFDLHNVRPLEDGVAQLKAELEKFEDERNQKRHAIGRLFGQDGKVLFQAMAQLDALASRLEQPANVVAFSVEVTDSRYSSMVENGLNRNQLLTIVVSRESDYFLLKRELLERHRLRVNIAMPRFDSRQSSSMTSDQLCELGFEGYLIDFVKAPEPVLQFLKQHARFHEIPVRLGGRESMTVEQLLERNRQWRFGVIFFSGKCLRIRGAYGAQSVREDRVRPSQIFECKGNNSAKEALAREISKKNRLLEVAKSESREIENANNLIREDLDRLRGEVQLLRSQRSTIFQKGAQYNNLTLFVEEKRDTLAHAVELKKARTWEKARMVVQLRQNRLKIVDDLCHSVIETQSQTVKLARKRVKLKLGLMECISLLQCDATRLTDCKTELSKFETAFQRVDEEYKSSKDSVRRLAERVQSVIGEISEESREELQLRGDDVSTRQEDVEKELQVLNSKLKLVVVDRPRVIEEYQSRQKKILELQQVTEKQFEELQSIREQIGTIDREWRLQLKELLDPLNEEFSKSFERLGCAGQIQLREDPDDYGKFGIEILVKFRETENLKRLNGQQQSGGERAVSTIMYLMAMQQLSNVPFRVVDEINQGMDPRNERQVHNQLVKIACQPQKSQYFLITPKLLSNLEYHPRMRILCIFNGSYLDPFSLQ